MVMLKQEPATESNTKNCVNDADIRQGTWGGDRNTLKSTHNHF